MSVGSTLNLLNELKYIILFIKFSLVMNLHKFNILFITYAHKQLLVVKIRSFFTDTHNSYV